MRKFLIIIVYSFIILTEEVSNDNCKVAYPQMRKRCICTTNWCNNNTFINSSIQQLNYSVKGLGDVDINLNSFNLCENNTYMAVLKVHETVNSSEECAKIGKSKILGDDHSQLELKNCMLCENEFSTISFEYIFTGCYELQIYENDIRIAKSNSVYINTNYKKKLIDGVFEIRDDFSQALQNITIIKVIMASSEITKPPSILTNLHEANCFNFNNNFFNNSKINCDNLKSKTQIATNNSQKYETFSKCSNLSNTIWFCNYTKNAENYITYLCTYRGLNPGKYIFEFKLLDEYTRCNTNSIWTKYSCHKSHTLNVPQVTVQKSNHRLQKNSQLDIHLTIILSALILILLLTITTLYLYKKHRLQNQSSAENIEEAQTINLISKPTLILLIYARDSELFDEMLETFKKLLLSYKNTKVYDINMCGKYSYLDEDWIRGKISNANTKVILFLNKCAVILHYNPTVLYVYPRREDKFFRYAIKQLQTTKSRNHKNFFVIGLANFYKDSTISLNLEVRYSMPNNIINLLRVLFDNQQEYDQNLITEFVSKCHGCNMFYKLYPSYSERLFKY